MIIKLFNIDEKLNTLIKNVDLKKPIIKLEGVLREGTSLLNPNIMLNLNASALKQEPIIGNILKNVQDDTNRNLEDDKATLIQVGINSTILTCNYMYIEEFERYYFINDIISLGNNLWEIEAHVDVLMTFKDYLANMEIYCLRNAVYNNSVIEDNEAPLEYIKDTRIYDTDNLRPANNSINTTFKATPDDFIISRNIALTVLNNQIALPIDTITNPIDGSSVSAMVAGQAISNVTYTTVPVEIQKLFNYLISAKGKDYYSYVLSVIMYPFELKHQKDLLKLTLGTEATDVNVEKVETQLSDYLIIDEITAMRLLDRGSFLSFEPYTTAEIYIPYVGWTSISMYDLLYRRLVIGYSVDYTTGQAQAYIWDKERKDIIFTSACQLGINIPINTSNAFDLQNSKLINNIGIGLNGLAAIGSVGIGIATGNPLAVAGGVMKGLGAGADYASRSLQMAPRASGSLSSGCNAVYAPQEVKIRITRSNPTPGYKSGEWKATHGLPLMENRSIKELRGFTTGICEPHISSATSTEINEIKALLQEGIII